MISSLRISPDGKWLAVVVASSDIDLWRIEGPRPVKRDAIHDPHMPGVGGRFDISPDGKSIVTLGVESESGLSDDSRRFARLTYWDAITANPDSRGYRIPMDLAGSVRFAPDGRRVVVLAAGRTAFLDIPTGTIIYRFPRAEFQGGIGLLTDGRHLISAHANGCIYVRRWNGLSPAVESGP